MDLLAALYGPGDAVAALRKVAEGARGRGDEGIAGHAAVMAEAEDAHRAELNALEAAARSAGAFGNGRQAGAKRVEMQRKGCDHEVAQLGQALEAAAAERRYRVLTALRTAQMTMQDAHLDACKLLDQHEAAVASRNVDAAFALLSQSQVLLDRSRSSMLKQLAAAAQHTDEGFLAAELVEAALSKDVKADMLTERINLRKSTKKRAAAAAAAKMEISHRQHELDLSEAHANALEARSQAGGVSAEMCGEMAASHRSVSESIVTLESLRDVSADPEHMLNISNALAEVRMELKVAREVEHEALKSGQGLDQARDKLGAVAQHARRAVETLKEPPVPREDRPQDEGVGELPGAIASQPPPPDRRKLLGGVLKKYAGTKVQSHHVLLKPKAGLKGFNAKAAAENKAENKAAAVVAAWGSQSTVSARDQVANKASPTRKGQEKKNMWRRVFGVLGLTKAKADGSNTRDDVVAMEPVAQVSTSAPSSPVAADHIETDKLALMDLPCAGADELEAMARAYMDGGSTAEAIKLRDAAAVKRVEATVRAGIDMAEDLEDQASEQIQAKDLEQAGLLQRRASALRIQAAEAKVSEATLRAHILEDKLRDIEGEEERIAVQALVKSVRTEAELSLRQEQAAQLELEASLEVDPVRAFRLQKEADRSRQQASEVGFAQADSLEEHASILESLGLPEVKALARNSTAKLKLQAEKIAEDDCYETDEEATTAALEEHKKYVRDAALAAVQEKRRAEKAAARADFMPYKVVSAGIKGMRWVRGYRDNKARELEAAMRELKDAEAEFAAKLPLMRKAQNSLDMLGRSAATELENMRVTPPEVIRVLRAVCELIGSPSDEASAIRTFRTDVHIFAHIKQYDIRGALTADPFLMSRVNRILDGLEGARVAHIYHPAGELCLFMDAVDQYAEAEQRLAPLRDKLKDMRDMSKDLASKAGQQMTVKKFVRRRKARKTQLAPKDADAGQKRSEARTDVKWQALNHPASPPTAAPVKFSKAEFLAKFHGVDDDGDEV
mmetsp:Transcript_22977/g.78224  ORF Transcript_22977/g.78224 Transcript_22977/m.78224 type:complete len:1017 (+) Transcript_22977:137-3187(+)